jgi:hypothetical protein
VSARALAVALALLAFSSGCSVRYGTTPRVEELVRLTRGVSTLDEVRKVLGEPRGRGAARLSVGSSGIWLYDAGEEGSGNSRIKYLLVFLRDGVYDGFFWFEAGLKLEDQP